MKITRRQLLRLIKEQVSAAHIPDDGAAGFMKGQYPEHIKTANQKQQYDTMKSAERRAAKHGNDGEYKKFLLPIAEVIGSFVPVASQLIAMKDMTLALKKVLMSGGDEGKIDTAVAAISFIPGMGTAASKAYRATVKVAKASQKTSGNVLKLTDSEAEEKAEEITAQLKKKHPKKFS
jgi:hypothetical protein